MRPEFLRCGAFRFSLERPLIMGVINVTPDSFSDGGELVDPQLAITRAKTQLEQGADILDIGGESTRPGAAPVSLEMSGGECYQSWKRCCPWGCRFRLIRVNRHSCGKY